MAVKDQLQQAMNQRPLHDPFALYGPSSPERQEGRIAFATDDADMTFFQEWNRERPLYDPLTLYPDSSDERRNNRIQVLESDDDLATIVARSQAVVDPLQLYPKNDSVVEGDSSRADLSQALPFMSRPVMLDGTLAGDAGFDPLGLASNKEKLLFYRDAELKHSRIAMLVRIHSVKGVTPVDELSTPKLDQSLTVCNCLRPPPPPAPLSIHAIYSLPFRSNLYRPQQAGLFRNWQTNIWRPCHTSQPSLASGIVFPAC
jgi:hypothetical protein